MGWLLDNSLANMQGADFLVFYGVVACIVLTGAYFFIALQDTPGGRLPPAPSVIDPYELAYLRGGVNEVIRTAVYSLRQQGLIDIDQGRISATGFKAQELTSIERRVYEGISPGSKIAALFSRQGMREPVGRLCAAYKQRLSAQQLLAAPEARLAVYLAVGVAGGLLIALAAYKIWAAAMHGHSNVGFLFGEAAASCVALAWILQKTTGGVANKRGKAFLAQIQLAYSGGVNAVLGGATGGSALVMVGLFGFAILKGTPDAALAKAFAQSSGSGGDGGGGCGGGDGGGGCGGCGGGD